MFNKPIKPAADIDAVRRSAFWHLGRRDHSEQELRGKLARKTTNQQWIDTVIEECFSADYLNEKRFIENFIRFSQNKSYGQKRIARDLKNKGLSTEEVNLAFSKDHYDYIKSAAKLLQSRYKQGIYNPYLKQKAMAFLQAKGHDFDDIFKAVNEHNQNYAIEDTDPVNDAVELLNKKFRESINNKKSSDKATRFLLSRGYKFDQIKDAVKLFNEQINQDLNSREE